MSGITKLNEFLAHAKAKDLPLAVLLDLKADAFEACAIDSDARGDHDQADAERTAAVHARNAAATERAPLDPDHHPYDGDGTSACHRCGYPMNAHVEWAVRLADGGASTCPICGRSWTVTPWDDCLLPACGCYGHDVGPGNPNRPCNRCGLRHALAHSEPAHVAGTPTVKYVPIGPEWPR